jgi:GNAT superfamily N-acetyltransferase
MNYRRAIDNDIDAIMQIRLSVKENTLTDPSKISKQMCSDYLDNLGRAWVCECNDQTVGFSYAAKRENSIWALFVLTEFEGHGFGKNLLKKATDWLFDQGAEKVILETEANTRADNFYQSQGWQRGDVKESGDVELILIKEKQLKEDSE